MEWLVINIGKNGIFVEGERNPGIAMPGYFQEIPLGSYFALFS
jgi:hypothetical protein